jgi:hypothetical protein
MAHCDANSVVWEGFSFRERFDDLPAFCEFLSASAIESKVPATGPWELLVFPPSAIDVLVAVDSDGTIVFSGKNRRPTDAECQRLSHLMHRALTEFYSQDDEYERDHAQVQSSRQARYTGGDGDEDKTASEDAHTEEPETPRATAPLPTPGAAPPPPAPVAPAPEPQPAPVAEHPGPLQRASRGAKRIKDSVVTTVSHCVLL